MEKVNPRLEKLAFLLTQMDRIHLRDAAKMLNVSEMTIRRDLSTHTGSIMLLGGYIVSDSQKGGGNYQLFEHQSKNIAQKMELGKLAASLVEDNDVVFFDCGTTIPFIISQIENHIKFTALCCSINAFVALQEKSNCQVILCGGNYSRHNAILTPIQTVSELDLICTNKAFISAAGVNVEQGVTCFDLKEAQIKRKAMLKTQQKILVVDSFKLNRVEQAYIAALSEFDRIICDQPLPAEFQL
ncbi:DNA-binding transcriptional repressor DeoR [[Haemophilus] felis]|uniref:DNA-binding transcriptional repressor DeoR n=1 Tax=[Haemophilus] felis TaxID=123822 RepID=A0A1T0B8H4_9PAST|nr:DNA-binding transcriptional repressor DeoR [[Haemophilus] felis]NBI40397.1 DNA-binding transcriptional repressor DeoR [[Haemophilus] felis]OOS06500.1 DNA-binding transcriptional repressor DeoR [[Haemophilus] felis]